MISLLIYEYTYLVIEISINPYYSNANLSAGKTNIGL